MSKSRNYTQEEIDEIAEKFEAALTDADRLLFTDKNYERAIEKYAEVIKICKEVEQEDPDHFINRGIALDQLGRYEEAVESFDEAIKLDPEKGTAYNGRANALDHWGRKEQDPDTSRVYYEAAVSDYDQAIALKPRAVGYICNKVKTLQLMGQDRLALEALNQAYELIQSGNAREESGENAVIVERTLAERGDLLQKVMELEAAAADTEEWIDEHGDEETKEEASQLKVIRQSITSEMVSFLAQEKNFTDMDAGVVINALMQRVAEVDSQYQDLQDKYEKLKLASEQQGASIEDHEVRIVKLELSHHEMQKMVKELKAEGVKNTESVIAFLEKLQGQISVDTPPEIARDPYKLAFYEALERDLNATYVAALSVQSDIVANGKKGELLGNMASILNVAGSYIPTVGGGVMMLGAMMSAIDSRQQDVMVKKFADMATGVRQMERVVKEIADMLVRDDFDKSLLSSQAGMGEKFKDYMVDFFKEISGASGKKAQKVASDAAIDLMEKMGVAAAEDFSVRESTSRFKMPSLIKFGKKKGAAAESEQEEVKRSPSFDKSTGEADGHKIASIIISKIYKGEISAASTASETAKIAVCSVLAHFDLSTNLVEALDGDSAHAPHIDGALLGDLHGHGADGGYGAYDDGEQMAAMGES